MEDLTQGARSFARYFDHTLLRVDATAAEFEKLFQEAMEYQFYSVCIPPNIVLAAKKALRGSSVKVCTVVGFPTGYATSSTKTFETKTAIEHGADEIDMVIQVGALKSGEKSIVLEDIKSVVRSSQGHTVKVILETCFLTDEEKLLACELSLSAGAHFVKTSTGFGPAGATEADVRLMCTAVASRAEVKASGGIRDLATAQKFIALGATRIGSSSGVSIMKSLLGDPSKTPDSPGANGY